MIDKQEQAVVDVKALVSGRTHLEVMTERSRKRLKVSIVKEKIVMKLMSLSCSIFFSNR